VGVLQNERGFAGIDDAPVAARARVEIAEGCACCVRNPDLVNVVRELSSRGDLDWLLFEASGLADPLPLVWTLGRPDLADRVLVDAVLSWSTPATSRTRGARSGRRRYARPTSSTSRSGTWRARWRARPRPSSTSGRVRASCLTRRRLSAARIH
jgi:hypothetical protein